MSRLFAAGSALVLVLVLALASCSGDDDDGGGDGGAGADDTVGAQVDDEFCTTAATLVEVLEGDGDDVPTDEELAAIDELVAEAPPAVSDDFEVLRDGLVVLSGLQADDAEGFETALDVFFDPEFIGAFEQVGIFLQAQCGLEVDTPSDAAIVGGDGEGSSSGAVDTSALRDFLAAEDPDLEDRVQSIASLGGVELSVGVRGLEDASEAVQICELLSGYLYDEVGADDTTLKVQDPEANDLAVREGADDECVAA